MVRSKEIIQNAVQKDKQRESVKVKKHKMYVKVCKNASIYLDLQNSFITF